MRESFDSLFFWSLDILKKMKSELQPSKIVQAEARWGEDLLARVFMNINNLGRRGAFRKYEAEENYEALECIIFLTGNR